MVKGLYTAYTGMVNEQRRLDVLSNNLANSTTNGFKKEGMVAQSFNNELAIKIKDTSVPGKIPQNLGNISLGAKVGETYTNWDQGSMKITDKASDLAISGEGFFAIEYTNKSGESSIMYTRDGAFTVNSEGYFVTSDGDYLLNAEGAASREPSEDYYIKIDPNKDYAIDEQGNIFQDGQIVSRIGLTDFDNYDYVTKYGENLYGLADGGNLTASRAEILQGCLEASNVNVVDEMVNMIQIARAYEAGQKVIQTMDSTLQIAATQVGKV